MGLLRLLFGHGLRPTKRRKVSAKSHLDKPEYKKTVRRNISAPAPAATSRPAPRKTSLAHPDPAAPQNVTLPSCRYPKRAERAERAKLVYRHACTPGPTILKGRCYVIDGDTISISSVPIRLAGIDAPELDHPYGQAAKWAMVKITKGQIITARIAPEMSYDRTVAICCLPDGRDIAAELVKQGLALDWPLFSKGRYRAFEPEGVRRKLWMTNKRQPPAVRG